MTRRVSIACALALGCGPKLVDDRDTDAAEAGEPAGNSATSSGGSSLSGTPPATTSMGQGTVASDDGEDATFGPGEAEVDDGSTFFGLPDACAPPPDGASFHCGAFVCDPFLQDCPRGEKCMPWANDGGAVWNSFRCAPVEADPGQAGDPCVVEGSGVSGIDDCDIGLMCFWVDPDTNEGTCVSWCGGTARAPTCDDGSTCTTSDAGVLALCLGVCDPLASECEGGYCGWLNDSFACIGERPGTVPVGSPCEFQECVPAGTCLDASETGDCGGVGCCASWCDLTAAEPDALCLPRQTCVPWWERGEAPESLSHVGVCALPQ